MFSRWRPFAIFHYLGSGKAEALSLRDFLNRDLSACPIHKRGQQDLAQFPTPPQPCQSDKSVLNGRGSTGS